MARRGTTGSFLRLWGPFPRASAKAEPVSDVAPELPDHHAGPDLPIGHHRYARSRSGKAAVTRDTTRDLGWIDPPSRARPVETAQRKEGITPRVDPDGAASKVSAPCSGSPPRRDAVVIVCDVLMRAAVALLVTVGFVTALELYHPTSFLGPNPLRFAAYLFAWCYLIAGSGSREGRPR
jgi:hypothetical protein